MIAKCPPQNQTTGSVGRSVAIGCVGAGGGSGGGCGGGCGGGGM